MMFGYHGDDEVILAPPAPPTESGPDWGSLPCEVVNLILQFHKQNNLDWWIDLMKTRAHEGHYLCPPEHRWDIVRRNRHQMWVHPIKRSDFKVDPSGTHPSYSAPIVELHVNRNFINHQIFAPLGKVYAHHRLNPTYEAQGCLFPWGRLAIGGFVGHDGSHIRRDLKTNHPTYKIKNCEEVECEIHRLQNRTYDALKTGGKVRCSRCGHQGHNKTNDKCPALTCYKFGVHANYTTY